MGEVCAMKVRIRFRKYGSMKYVGHLDLMRYFQKAIRMSEIDICYSEGFSPHQMMSFASPLGVGLTSDGEYLDLEVHTSRSSKESMAALNAVMPEGMEITGYVRLDDHAKTAMSVVSAADYEIWFQKEAVVPEKMKDFERLKELLQEFLSKPERMLVRKKTKKSEKVMDLKPLVYDFRVLEPQERFFHRPAFYLDVCTGSMDNVKPELVLVAFFGYLDLEYDPYALQIHRKDVYFTDVDGKRKTLLQAGAEMTDFGEERID